MTSLQPPSTICIPYALRLPRAEIGYLRFLLEGYEGIAQLEALGRRDEVTLWVPSSRQREFEELLGALKEELGVRRIPSLP